jgi:hypothetical protein
MIQSKVGDTIPWLQAADICKERHLSPQPVVMSLLYLYASFLKSEARQYLLDLIRLNLLVG